MSKYTTEVRFICETAAGLLESEGYSSVNEVIDKAIPKVFDFDFPIFDEKYRNILCRKILKHYYTREICAETVGLWKLWLDTRMNEIMPYFNQLYKSELIEFNPMYDMEVTRSGNRDNSTNGNDSHNTTRNSTANAETTTTATESNSSTTTVDTDDKTIFNNTNKTQSQSEKERTERDLYSETPQGALDNVENENYLTNARKKLGGESGSDIVTANGSGETVYDGSTNTSVEGDTSSDSTITSTGTNVDTISGSNNRESTTTEEYLETVKGKQGGTSYSKMLMEYRKTFLNIDMQVIESLSDLFFGLW